jgi:hypothetical protein
MCTDQTAADTEERETRAQIAQTEQAEAEDRVGRAVGLFDLRLVIGGLLALYGVALIVTGVVASAATKAKAVGINIDLWAGLAMAACGAVFLAWAALRPLRAEQVQESDADR